MAAPVTHITGNLVNTWSGKLALELECQKHAEIAVNALVELLTDPKQPGKVRIDAAAQILDRGYGKPVDRIAVASITDTTDSTQYQALTTRQLLQLVAGNIRQPLDIEGETPDTDPDQG